jgi:predicted PurR-regulated permease PerM
VLCEEPASGDLAGTTVAAQLAVMASSARSDSLRSLAITTRILALGTVVALLYFGAPVLMPLVLSVFLFYALDPIVDRLESWGAPRLMASMGVVLAVVGAIGLGAFALSPQVEAIVARVPEGVQRLRATLRASRQSTEKPSTLERVQEAARAIDRAAAESMEPPATPRGTLRVEVTEPWRATDWMWAGGVGALGLVGQAGTVLFLTIFLLNEDDSFKRKLVRRMETHGEKRLTVQILNDIAVQMERFIWVQIMTSTGVAVATALALWWLGLNQPAAWGVFAGLLNIVPFFGPFIVTAVLSAAGFLQFGTISGAAWVAGIALAITTIEGNVITPHLLSRAAHLNLVATFVSIAFWSWLWGVPGMLLAVPMLMAIKVASDHVDGLQGVSDFLGD